MVYFMVPATSNELNICLDAIFPDPGVVYPLIPGVAVAVQVNDVPAKLDSKIMGVVNVPAQISCERGELVTKGIGFTVTTRFFGVPGQLEGAGP